MMSSHQEDQNDADNGGPIIEKDSSVNINAAAAAAAAAAASSEMLVGAQFGPHHSSTTTTTPIGGAAAVDATAAAHACDRRLSRAARSLLVRPLRSILSTLASADSNEAAAAATADGSVTPISTASVWELLERSLAPSAYNINNNNNKHQCPLIPSRDVLRYHEEQSIVWLPPPSKASSRIGMSIRSALYQQTKRSWQATAWYQCGLCGKMFSSRYYLDQHFDQHHPYPPPPPLDASPITSIPNSSSSISSNDSHWICPATSWCPGLPSCSHHALEVEPYYGPGSAGRGAYDRATVHRSLWHQVAHHDESAFFCDDDQMRAQKYVCQQLMRDCFAPVVSSDNDNNDNDNTNNIITEQHQATIHRLLEQSLCEPISCPDRLHQLFYAAAATTTASSNDAAALMMKHVHEWQDEWQDYYDAHHGRGRLGIGLLVVLGLGYAVHLWRTYYSQQQRGSSQWLRHSKHKQGSRLLQKKGSQSSSNNKASASSLLGTIKAKLH